MAHILRTPAGTFTIEPDEADWERVKLCIGGFWLASFETAEDAARAVRPPRMRPAPSRSAKRDGRTGTGRRKAPARPASPTGRNAESPQGCPAAADRQCEGRPGGYGMSEAIHTALSALRANLRKLDVTADNLANANTHDFKKGRASFEEAAPAGVKVTLTRVETPGTPLPPDEVLGEGHQDDPGGRRNAGHPARHPRLNRSRALSFELLFSPRPPVL